MVTYSFIKKYLLSFVLISFVLLNLGCKKTPTQPPDDKPTTCTYPTGNRNFTWRMDTIAWFPSTLGGVWAFSDSDAYVMGYIFEGKPPYSFSVGLHWNGKIWDKSINGSFSEINHYPNDVTGDDFFMVTVGYWAIGQEKAGFGEFDNRTKKWKGYQTQMPGQLRSVWTDGKGFFIAAGDNGMVYTKDGYTAAWVYQKAPTEFNFYKVSGITKNEIYLRAARSLTTGEHYTQIWKYYDNSWTKLMDNQDTTNTPIKITQSANGNIVNEIDVFRCSITDSLLLVVTGRESYEFYSKRNSNEFTKVNLTSKGLPLSQLHKTGLYVTLYSPNDYWITSADYDLYHWNGKDFKKIEPSPSLPYGQPWGVVSRIKKNNSGKIWMLLEMDPQVYAVIQGTP